MPNTNIASNIGPQFDPKDIDYMEVNRGSYSAEFGDRTYGVFNIVPRTGFERNNEAEAGSQRRQLLPDQRPAQFWQPHRTFRLLRQRERQPQQPGHSDSGSAGRARRRERLRRLRVPDLQRRSLESTCGSSPPCARTTTRSLTIPFPTTSRMAPFRRTTFTPQYPSIGLRDGDHESDAIVNFSWVHTFNSKLLLTVSPFYHYNRANYDSSPNDFPSPPRKTAARPTAAAKPASARTWRRTICRSASYSFYQHDNELFGAHLQRRQRQPAVHRYRTPLRQPGCILYRRQIQSHSLADADGRHAAHAFLRRSHGKRHQPALWGGAYGASPELDLPRLLRPLLPGAAADHSFRPADAVCPGQQPGIYPACTASATKSTSSA